MIKRTSWFVGFCWVVGLVTLTTVVVGASWNSTEQDEDAVARPWLEDEPACSCLICPASRCDDPEPKPDVAIPVEQRLSREVMAREVVDLWTMWFDDERAPANDPRRERFEEHALDLADAVIMYQDEPTDIGGQLPGGRDDHLVVAYMVARESSVTYDVVGAMGEVGLGQLHGVALAGYAPEVVQHNPRLGLLLMVRWLASQLPKCPSPDLYDMAWSTDDWVAPLSLYAGGHRAIKADGTCARFSSMQERITQVLIYRARIGQPNRDGA